MVKWILSVLIVLAVAVDAKADCNGVSARKAVAQRPSILQKIRAARTASCSSGEWAASCSGPVQASSCSQSVIPAAPAPEPVYEVFEPPKQAVEEKAVNVPVFVVEAAPVCENGRCNVIRNVVTAPARIVSNAYQEALASAQYRAANRIHGHSSLDTHRTSGVGWASGDANPTTCLGRGGEAYAVVRGADGWYATKFQ